MKARVTIYDDNDNPKGAYELAPSRIYEGGISTKYVFEFEYNQLNCDKYEEISDTNLKMWEEIFKAESEEV